VATTQSRRRSATLGLFTILSIVVLRGGFHGWTSPTTYAVPGTVAAALFLGWAVANRRAYVAEIKDRAERAERTKEEEARRRVDAERLRIARELHDVVAHSIATINVQAGAGAHVLPDQPEQAGAALAAIKASSKEAMRELRAILDVLRQVDEADPTAPAPSLDQLDVLVTAARRAGVSTEVSVVGEPRVLPPTVDLAAYRIVQESLTNVLRHAGPASASILLTYGEDHVVVQVDDDGRGTTHPRDGGAVREGHGITGMKERASVAGGSLDAEPRDNRGFRVRACLPTRATT
ncbi:MAG TPA: histidine kinase, partial [Acidimicrobiales bacterium]|nr:histidine kinase [Acidimicrobiales bacterium]